MNQKNLVVILGFAVVILLGTTIYFATVSNVSQPESVINQSVKPVPVAQTPATNQQVNNTPVSVTNENSALKTYSNQKYGFSLSYPENYKIKETNWEKEPQSGGSIYLIQLGDATVTDFETDFDKGILVYVAKIEKDLANGTDPLAAPNGMDQVSKKDTILDGQKARIYNNGQVYTVAKNGYEYLLTLGDQANQSTKDNFAKIVTSFKFTK